MANNCATCFYHWKCGRLIGCKYYEMTGQRRPCPAGDGCTVKVGYRKRYFPLRKKKEADHVV